MYKLLDAGVVVNIMLITKVYEFFELGDSAEKRAFMDHIRYGRPLDVDPNSSLGATNLEILNGIKTDANQDYQTKLDSFLAKCDEDAQVPDTPKTQYEIQRENGTLQKTPVQVDNGFAYMTTNADCESHNPQIYQKVTVNGIESYIRVAAFGDVSKKGNYITKCPKLENLYVDDVYSIIE